MISPFAKCGREMSFEKNSTELLHKCFVNEFCFIFFFHVSPSIYTRWRVLTYIHVGLIISRAVCRAKKEKDTFEIEIVRFQRERNLI